MDGRITQAESALLVIVACEKQEILDEALLRPGRLNTHVRLTAPLEADLLDILKVHTRSVRSVLHESVSLSSLSRALYFHGATSADVPALVREAVVSAIRESVLALEGCDPAGCGARALRLHSKTAPTPTPESESESHTRGNAELRELGLHIGVLLPRHFETAMSEMFSFPL